MIWCAEHESEFPFDHTCSAHEFLSEAMKRIKAMKGKK